MGYYTNFKLKIISNPNSLPENPIFSRLEEISGYGGIEEYGGELYDVKWYNHEEDLILLSEEYDELVFQLDGKGEENGDIWRKFFKNGKYSFSQAIITFPDYDESKLE
jgi:hypothetical protein